MEPYPCDKITQAPNVEPYFLHHLLHSSYGIRQAGLEQLTGYEDCNFLLTDVIWEDTDGPNKAILKVTNPLEAEDGKNLDFQVKVCEILNKRGVPCPKIIKRKDGLDWAKEEVLEGVCLPVRLFEVLPGTNLENFPFEPRLVEEIGELLARVHVAVDEAKLTVTHVPYIAVEHRQSILREADLQLQRSIISAERAQLIRECLGEFDELIANHHQQHDFGVIHSDFNETNILVSVEDGVAKVTGVLDFGDMHESYRIVDIASTVLYLHLSDRLKQGVDALAKAVMTGYSRARPLPDCTHLLTAMKARLSCSLIYGLRTARINFRGGDVNYVLRTQSNGWNVLEELHKKADC